MKIFVFFVFCLFLASCATVHSNKMSYAKVEREKWQEKAKAGDPEAQYQLGAAYCCGEGFFSTEEAVEWWCKASGQGHSRAKVALDNINARCDKYEVERDVSGEEYDAVLEIEKLKWLEKADPVIDAQQALKNGDIRLRAVYGYTLIVVPGIESVDYPEYESVFGFNPIDGTSDALLNEQHSRLISLAFKYALEYNKVILDSQRRDEERKSYRYQNYKVISCNLEDWGIAFGFADKDRKVSRNFTLSRNNSELTVGFSGGKGFVRWDQVERIIYEKFNETEGYVTIEFDQPYAFLSWEEYKKLEFGVMPEECWERLNEVVGGNMKTELISQRK